MSPVAAGRDSGPILPQPLGTTGGAMPTLTAGHGLALAVSQSCINKVSSIVYSCGILPTIAEGELFSTNWLLSLPLIGTLLAFFIKPESYRFRLELKQPDFNFIGDNNIQVSGKANVSILKDGTEKTKGTFTLSMLITVSLATPGTSPTQYEEPQVKVDVSDPKVMQDVSGLPQGLESAMDELGDAILEFFVDYVLKIPAFPAFSSYEGYSIILRNLEIKNRQLIVLMDFKFPGIQVTAPDAAVLGTGPVTVPGVGLVAVKVPFTLRHPYCVGSRASVSGVESSYTSARVLSFHPLPPHPRDITVPQEGYDIALAINQMLIQDVLKRIFPYNFSYQFADPLGRVDFSLNASFQLMDSTVKKIKLLATITGQNSRAAEVLCDCKAEFDTEVTLSLEASGVKGVVDSIMVHFKDAGCRFKLTGMGADASSLLNWLASEVNLKKSINDKLTELFGEPLIPLTFTIFRQTISDSNLIASINLSNVDIVQDELQVWITINGATAPSWHWRA